MNVPEANTKKKTNRRYYLHQKIKEQFRYSALKRTVYISCFRDIDNDQVLELRDRFGYSIQTEIN